MRVASLPAIDPTEQPFAGRQGLEMLLHKRPGPLRHADDTVSVVVLCSARSHLATLDIHVRLDTRESGRDFYAGAIQQRE